MHSRPRASGFSLLELLAVVTILGVIAAIVIPRISVSADAAKQAGTLQYRSDLNDSLERYYFETGGFPPDLETLKTQGYYPEAIPLNPVTNQPFQLNSATGRVKID
jgi:general secretion pathway protein G